MRTLVKRLGFLFFLLSLLAKGDAQAIYTSHLHPDKRYQQAASPFLGVILIEGTTLRKGQVSSGTGTLLQDASSGETFILTAAHVLRGAQKYEITYKKERYTLEKISFFHDFLFENFHEKTILVAKDILTHKRLFVLRLKEEQARLKEVLMSYGLDIGFARVKNFTPSLDHILYHLDLKGEARPEKSWVVGFGEAGSGSALGRGFPFWVYGAGTKRAFETLLRPRYQFQLLHKETMSVEGTLFSYASLFKPGDAFSLSGQVGPGDSGGPAISQESGKVFALVSGTVSKLKRQNPEEDTLVEKILRRFGSVAPSRSPLSYFLWQEGNVYGSEAIYAGVSTPLIHQWIQKNLSQ